MSCEMKPRCCEVVIIVRRRHVPATSAIAMVTIDQYPKLPEQLAPAMEELKAASD